MAYYNYVVQPESLVGYGCITDHDSWMHVQAIRAI